MASTRRRYKELHLAQLRSFCQVAASGSFTAAAEKLGLALTTVWQQVRALERVFGSRLVQRQGRRTLLTPEGQLLCELARGHVSGLDSLPRLFAARQSYLAPTVALATPQGIFNFNVPPVIRAFLADHPSTRLEAIITDSDSVVSLIERGAADLGIACFEPETARPAGLVSEDLFRLRLALLTPTRHPLNRKRTLAPADLMPYRLIQPAEGPGSARDHAIVYRWLNRYKMGTALHPVLRVPYLETIARYVAAGIGVCVVPMCPVAEDTLPGVHVRFLPDAPSVVACLVHRRGAHLSAAARALRSRTLRLLTDREFQS